MRGKSATPKLAIEPGKLKEAIRNHNYAVHDLSEELGYGHSYLSQFTSGARLEAPRRLISLLETVGIHYESYKPEERIETAPVDQPITAGVLTVRLDEEQMSQLSVMIREQVYEAMARIWGVSK